MDRDNQRYCNQPSIISPKDYFDTNGFVKTDLFVDKAEKIAQSFNSGGIKGTQIRKFYDEVLRLKLQIESADNQEEKFKEILPYIKMLIPKVVYA
ncbi:MAG: type III-A CRISPR-associated protein Csm2, partial [Desulfurella sp.]